ncbi:MAG: hypothetical protein ACSLEM_04705 [Candidatus Malihini olakiniferum]
MPFASTYKQVEAEFGRWTVDNECVLLGLGTQAVRKNRACD